MAFQTNPSRSNEKANDPLSSSNKPNSEPASQLVDHIKGVIYGNCIGDAIGLLTEFLDEDEAHMYYAPNARSKKDFEGLILEYHQKISDEHRDSWEIGDWTDDSDQMLLILKTFLHNDGQFNEKDFAAKLKNWVHRGFQELGDKGGCGLGRTTSKVVFHNDFLKDPHMAAQDVWECSGRYLAPNGGVMRTSIVGTLQFYDLEKVIANTKSACKVTHADPRCIASCIAVTIAIALMLQREHVKNDGEYDVDEITKIAHEHAEKVLEDEGHKGELKQYMFEEKLEKLSLGKDPIGYTFKCLGAGFWAFRQKDFRKAITKVTMEAGDADTNCAVAGALLGCKLGFSKLPETWVTRLCHRSWLEAHIRSYLELLYLPTSGL